jgi:transcriptional regulator with XRE-family HTH domain
MANMSITVAARIPDEVLAEQWFSFVHGMIGAMQAVFRTAQKNRDLNQRKIAERLGRKPSFISRCLSGQQNMTIRTIHDLARAMDCRLEVSFVPLDSLPMANNPAGGTHDEKPIRTGDSTATPAENHVIKVLEPV